MITVENAVKDFKKVIKQPGLKGSVQALFKPGYQVVHAVNDISFEVNKGEIMGFIGPNGAGKSTMIKMLTGILYPTSGSISVAGYDPQKQRQQYVQHIGVVFGQRTQLWWDLPLSETFTVLKEIYQVERKEFEQRMGYLNEVLDIAPLMSSPVRTLSLGQRMRADLAAAMLHRPKVLFLDEPTIGLDVVVKDNIRKAIANMNKVDNTTIILTTHDLADIELLSHRIMMIDHGKLVYQGTLNDLKDKYGKSKKIEFVISDINQPVQQLLSDRFSQRGIECSVEQEKGTLIYDRSIPSVLILKELLELVSIKDISIKESDVESIIKQIYLTGDKYE
ncbi:MAG: sugar ABC transporter ATP-binding protein [Chloroflexi bacterium HGW-Chloroflexi-5]|nr:MAG: sugar ABC transporter ATP-binding protein [Chloroflexi bacterium HGW-Chloroflexi-5]